MPTTKKKAPNGIPDWIAEAEEAFLSKPERLEKQAEELEAKHAAELAKFSELQQRRSAAYADPDTPGVEIAGLDIDLQRLEPRVRRLGDRIPNLRDDVGHAQEAITLDQRVAHVVADSLRTQGHTAYVVHDANLTAPPDLKEPVTLVSQTCESVEITRNVWVPLTEAEAKRKGWKVLARQNTSAFGDEVVEVAKPSGMLRATLAVRCYRPARPEGLTPEVLTTAGWRDPELGKEWDTPDHAARRAVLAVGRDETSQALVETFTVQGPAVVRREAKAVATDDEAKAASDAQAATNTRDLFGVGGAK